jgi:DDE superfamily endonuclease
MKITLKHVGRCSLSLQDQITIVMEAYSKPNNIKATGRKYMVQPSQIRRYKKKFDEAYVKYQTHRQLLEERRCSDAIKANAMEAVEIDNEATDLIYALDCQEAFMFRKRISKDYCRLPGGGRKSVIPPDKIHQLKMYFIDQREDDFPVTMPLLVSYLRASDPILFHDNISYSILQKRILRLLHKWNASYRKGTHKAQNTRFSYTKMRNFHTYIRMKMKMLGITENQVYNFDETNVPFAIGVKSTWCAKGKKNVSILEVKSSQRCTAMLGSCMNGVKATPFLIFGGTNTNTGRIKASLVTKAGLPQQLEYGVQKNAWVDESLMLEWIEKVWKPISLQHDQTLLVIDAHTAHLTAQVNNALKQCNTEVEVIPAGYTSKLQPMDVGINKPFKDRLRNEYMFWMKDNRIGKPNREIVSPWIETAWNSISQQTFVNAFIASGFGHFVDEVVDDLSEANEDDVADDDDDDILNDIFNDEDVFVLDNIHHVDDGDDDDDDDDDDVSYNTVIDTVNDIVHEVMNDMVNEVVNRWM